MDSNRFHLVRGDQEALDAAVAVYFEEHPELNPGRVSVELKPDGEGGYTAVGHVVVDAAPGYAAAPQGEFTLDLIAEEAFNAYAAQLGHTNHTMDVAEGWNNQGAEIKAGFGAAAQAIQDRILGKSGHGQ